MSSYKIEKKVEMPMVRTKYPFADMEVGDSFVVLANGDEHPGITRNRVAASVAAYKRKRTGARFTVRAVDGGMRCWRIE